MLDEAAFGITSRKLRLQCGAASRRAQAQARLLTLTNFIGRRIKPAANGKGSSGWYITILIMKMQVDAADSAAYSTRTPNCLSLHFSARVNKS